MLFPVMSFKTLLIVSSHESLAFTLWFLARWGSCPLSCDLRLRVFFEAFMRTNFSLPHISVLANTENHQMLGVSIPPSRTPQGYINVHPYHQYRQKVTKISSIFMNEMSFLDSNLKLYLGLKWCSVSAILNLEYLTAV